MTTHRRLLTSLVFPLTLAAITGCSGEAATDDPSGDGLSADESAISAGDRARGDAAYNEAVSLAKERGVCSTTLKSKSATEKNIISDLQDALKFNPSHPLQQRIANNPFLSKVLKADLAFDMVAGRVKRAGTSWEENGLQNALIAGRTFYQGGSTLAFHGDKVTLNNRRTFGWDISSATWISIYAGAACSQYAVTRVAGGAELTFKGSCATTVKSNPIIAGENGTEPFFSFADECEAGL